MARAAGIFVAPMSQPSVALVTDSTCDLPPDLARAHGVVVVPLTVTLEGRSYQDGVDITPEDFYRKLAASGAPAVTSQPSAGQFAAVYERALADHDRVLSLHLSSKLSGTYAAALQGAELVGRDRVRVVDTGMVSLPLALVVLAASHMLERGLDPERVVAELRPIQEAMRVYFVVDTLEYLRRGGRIGRAGALVGSLLQVKPVLTLHEGEVGLLERVRTQERALSRVIQLAQEVEPPLCTVVGHAAAGAAARRLAAALEPVSESLLVGAVGPVVGAHAGPGTVGVSCYPARLFPLSLTGQSPPSRVGG
jgi:DegV family protein with EDD domain